MNEKILVVEDDNSILTGIVDLLESEEYQVVTATDGKKALLQYEKHQPDLILLDIMIPELSGYDVCRTIRSQDALVPILMLTAKGQEVDKVVGLELGADDYIVKPFGIRELLARIHAAFRRLNAKKPSSIPEQMNEICFGSVSVIPKRFECVRGEKITNLTKRELLLLDYLYRHAGEVVTRLTLLNEIWGINFEGTTRTLDQHIAKLRQKIEETPEKPKHLITVHGVGYRFFKEQVSID
ncbi:MAG: response regulator transcription factor [Fibrobacter sp.]|nr:response regulator transcription factor [Fibrobacter sp.]